jgi:hypothetical protein
MLNVLRPLLLIAALTAVPTVHAETARGPQRDDAGARVRQVERDGGRVLQAQPMQRSGEEVYRLKVLTPEGRVRVLQGTPSERARSSEDMGARYQQGGARPLGNRALARDREERARERRAGEAGNNGGDPGRE